LAANTEGKREIVGLHIGPSEAETFWSTFLKSMVRHGLCGVKLVISDAHEGLKAAIRRVLSFTWQRCRVHWMRNALSYVPKGQQSMVSAALRQAFIQPDTTEPNKVVGAIHPKAMPVILITPVEIDLWMTAPAADALTLQRPLAGDALVIASPEEKREMRNPHLDLGRENERALRCCIRGWPVSCVFVQTQFQECASERNDRDPGSAARLARGTWWPDSAVGRRSA
jgi:hypothetical protein